ncbi:hypothetical protein [Desmospora activa]|uniref:Uncharacterized protein n=1 Tax=Desmospora activa DSM 45169 TaxID=1121389 RepID=A0A2T4ZD21_9BACL|nr:hypothetical protein [Desmospora activa]PTM59794.1 hypothetical protein C8J48_2426 [Desmospora activa DSM 45169]
MSQSTTKKLSWISILVIIAMLGSLLIPDYQLAYAAAKEENTTTKKENTKQELLDLRTQYSKTFKKGDEYILEEYLEPIHVEKKGE